VNASIGVGGHTAAKLISAAAATGRTSPASVLSRTPGRSQPRWPRSVPGTQPVSKRGLRETVLGTVDWWEQRWRWEGWRRRAPAGP